MFLTRLLMSACALLLLPLGLQAKPLQIYSEEWEGFTAKDGSGLYLDLVREIYQPLGYQLNIHIVPYKRSLDRIRHGGGDLALGVYEQEVDDLRYPRYAMFADDVSVLMRDKWAADWQGEQSLSHQNVIWQRGWGYEKYLRVPMQWFEVDDHDKAMTLLAHERYRYYLGAGVLFEQSPTPGYTIKFLRWLRVYPVFAQTLRGEELAHQWDEGMLRLLKRGQLATLFNRHHMERYYPSVANQ